MTNNQSTLADREGDNLDPELIARIITGDGCWYWAYALAGNGRAYFNNQLVYRILYKHCRGPIPKKLVLDHVVCDNPACINPWHVEPRTHGENVRRAGCANNLGEYAEKGNTVVGKNLGSFLGRVEWEHDERGQFTGR